jgi:hypothetical protein
MAKPHVGHPLRLHRGFQLIYALSTSTDGDTRSTDGNEKSSNPEEGAAPPRTELARIEEASHTTRRSSDRAEGTHDYE